MEDPIRSVHQGRTHALAFCINLAVWKTLFLMVRAAIIDILEAPIHNWGEWGRSYLISEGYSTEVEIITQAEAWLLLGRAAHTTLPIP